MFKRKPKITPQRRKVAGVFLSKLHAHESLGYEACFVFLLYWHFEKEKKKSSMSHTIVFSDIVWLCICFMSLSLESGLRLIQTEQ